MPKIKIICLLIAAVVLSIPQTGYADRRSYVWTYEYKTMPKGCAEIEYYLTEEQLDINKAKPNIWKHWIEVEYGITARWDIAMYQMFKQTNDADEDKIEYDGFKIRTRYRILEKGKLPVDTLLYLEYVRKADFSEPNILEGKLIIAKDIGDLNIAYNQIIEQELESGGETSNEYTAGINYKVFPAIRAGFESKGSFNKREYFVGPTISWSPGKFYVTAGMVCGLNDRSDDLQVRMIVGFLF